MKFRLFLSSEIWSELTLQITFSRLHGIIYIQEYSTVNENCSIKPKNLMSLYWKVCGGRVRCKLWSEMLNFLDFISCYLKTMFHLWKYTTENKTLFRPRRPVGLWDVEDPTLSGQLAHRWQWSCVLTVLYSPDTSFSVSDTHSCWAE
jgi:hypothetical protein